MQRVDPGLLEKSIYALELLGQLAHQKVPFVFKGGTCMLLLLPDIRRLSIDVDISCTLTDNELDSALAEISGNSRFELFEQDHRDPDRLPKRSHYKFHYTSAINGRTADILLDVMQEKCLYPETITKNIATTYAIPENTLSVNVPSVEGLIADKLTAFAPRTIGVLYSDRSSLKILKHCADIGVLYDHCANVNDIYNAYESIWPVENSYRENAFNREQVLTDTIDTSRLLCLLGLKGCQNSKETEILSRGITQLDSHIIGSRFSRDEAKICAAKAAYLATALYKGSNEKPLPRYSADELLELIKTPISEQNARLNRLGKGNPEAYYYWLKADQL